MVLNLESADRTIYMIELHEDDEDPAQAPDYAAKLEKARLNEEKFVKFMVEEVFAGISKDLTRAGQISLQRHFSALTKFPPQNRGFAVTSDEGKRPLIYP